jgi:phosphoglycerol transferase
MKPSALFRLGLPYVAGALACAAALTVVLKLWRADLGSPFRNDVDAIYSQVFVDNVLETGWYTTNTRAAAPYGMELHDFPVTEGFHFLVLKVISLFTPNVYRVVNVFFLLGFVLSTLSTVFALRWLDVRPLPAVVAGVLYAVLPYHFWRSEAHLFLASYYLVPVTLLVALWLLRGELPGDPDDPWRWRRRVVATVVAALISSAGVYYAFFGCFFFFAGAAGNLFRARRVLPVAAAALLSAVVSAGVYLNIHSSKQYALTHGPNPATAKRNPIEADFYGLNLCQFLLPREDHRLKSVAAMKHKFTYAEARPLPNDYGSTAGLVGVLGAFAAVGVCVFRRGDGGPSRLADLGGLMLCGILLGTIAGLGSLFAYFVSPQIRCYDRVSIFLNFLALGGAAVMLDGVMARATSLRARAAGAALCLGVLAFGVWDQTSPVDVPNYALRTAERRQVADFVKAMECNLPPGAMVFQLPVVDFPEGTPVNGTTSYDHFRMLVPRSGLRFSHGVVRGRMPAENYSVIGRLPVERVVDVACYLGFEGLHVDRLGYEDGGAEVVARLQMLLRTHPVACANGRDLFFPLTAYREKLLEGLSAEELDALRVYFLNPLSVEFPAPVDAEEFDARSRWRWCRGPAAEAVFTNPAPMPVRVRVEFKVSTPGKTPAAFRVRGLTECSFTAREGTPCQLSFVVPPGKHALRFESDAPPVPCPGRTIWFGLFDFNYGRDG